MFDGMFGITLLADARARSIAADNVHGEKGRGGMAGLAISCVRRRIADRSDCAPR